MESSSSSSSSSSYSWRFHLVYMGLVLGILYFLHYHLLLPFQIHQYQYFHNNNKQFRKRNPPLPLRFRSDADGHASFKILQVADMHYGNNGGTTRCRDVLSSDFRYCSDLNSTRFLRTLIHSENPDFIAFTGDNIFGSSATDAAESLFCAFSPAMESQLPWAAVLGNHDHESTMNREELMFFISLMDYSLSQINPQHENFSHIDGSGNYNLGVFGPPGSHLANTTLLNLLFLDTGDREIVDGIRTYGWIKESQLHWISHLSHEFKVTH